jgi:hypothetical protein
MKRLRLILALALFVPGFALLGAFSTLDSRFPAWWGLAVGGLLGVVFGLVFGGARGQWVDFLLGPEERRDSPSRREDV